MNPRLERALSEALEEELTRELAPILEPIMSRIKELIPTIMESCRLKLMRTSVSSDDDTVSTPSAISSGGGSSDSEPRSSKKQAKPRDSSTASRCSGSSFEIVPIAEMPSSKVQGKRPQRPRPSTSDMSVEGRQGVSSPGSSTDFSMFYPNASSEMPNLCVSSIDDSFDIGDVGGLLARSGGFPGDGIPPATEGSSAVLANTRGMAFEPYDFFQALPQQNNAHVPGPELGTWPLPGAMRDAEAGAHRLFGGEQSGDTIPQEQELHPSWDLMMEDFEFSNFSNR
jgi:hypothetical protein